MLPVLPVLSSNLSYEQIAEAEELRRSFRLFARAAWHVIEPGVPLLWNWHLDVICDHLQAVFERRIKRLAITIAPGHAKSSFVSVLFPVWCMLNDPYCRWLCASHSIDLATRDNKNRRDLIQSEWFQVRYGHLFQLSNSQNVKIYWENDHRGYSLALAVRSSGTGKRGTHLLIDDANNAMAGLADIEAVKEWFGKTWMSRLNDQENGPMIIVGQRLHESDLIGHVLKLGGWEHLNLPEEYDPHLAGQTSLGKYDIRTEEGELLWPAKFPRKVLEKLKRGLGPMAYSAQFQQSPIPSSGSIYKERDRRHYTVDHRSQSYLLQTPRGRVTIPIADCWTLAVVDIAASLKTLADFFVMETWAITPYKDALLLHCVHDHLEFPEQEDTIYKIFQRHHHSIIAIEKAGLQLAWIQVLIRKGLPIKPFTPQGDKIMRSTTGGIMYSNGKAYHNADMEGIDVVETELFKFPKAPHDDIADCHAMLAIVLATVRRPGVLDLDSEETEIDTTLSIENIITATAETEEQKLLAEEEKKLKEQEIFQKGGLLINPFEWAMEHEGGWQ